MNLDYDTGVIKLRQAKIPLGVTEQPLWLDDEDELARLCGLK